MATGSVGAILLLDSRANSWTQVVGPSAPAIRQPEAAGDGQPLIRNVSGEPPAAGTRMSFPAAP